MYVYGIAYTYLSIFLSWFATEYIPTYLHIDIFNHNKKKEFIYCCPRPNIFLIRQCYKDRPSRCGTWYGPSDPIVIMLTLQIVEIRNPFNGGRNRCSVEQYALAKPTKLLKKTHDEQTDRIVCRGRFRPKNVYLTWDSGVYEIWTLGSAAENRKEENQEKSEMLEIVGRST